MGNIILIGFMGSGKSSVSKHLCQKLDNKKIELDDVIAQKAGIAISEIFDKFGEDYFRDLETEALRDSVKGEDSIISCGGGTILRKENVQMMKNTGTIILLKASSHTIYDRVRCSDRRPILNNNMNVGFISELMDKRMDLYIRAADIIIDVDSLSLEEVTDKIIECIK